MTTALDPAGPAHGSSLRARLRPAYPALWLVIGAGLLLRALQLATTWFWQDDLALLGRASRSPLSADWLLQDYNGHLMPAKFGLFWMMSRTVGTSWLPAALLVLALSLLLWLLTWWALTQLYGRTPWRLAALALVVFCPLGVVSATWFTSALESLPVGCAIALVVGAHVRAVRSGDLRWVALAVGGLLLALPWIEKALLAAGVAVLVDLLIVGRPPRWLSPVRLALWGAYLVVTVGYLALFTRLVGLQDGAASSAHDVVRLAYEMALSLVPVGLAGGSWMAPSDSSTLSPILTQPLLLWVWVGFAVLVASGVRRRGWAAVRAALVLVVCLLLSVALIARARLDFLGPAIGRDPRYVTELVVVAALALPAMWLTPVRSGAADGGRVRGPAWLALLAVGAYALLAWPSAYLLAQARGETGAREWVATARASLAALDPAATVYDAPVPAGVVSPSFGSSALASWVLTGAPGTDRFDVPGRQVRVLDGSGAAVPATLVVSARSAPGPVPGCGYPVRGQPVTIPLDGSPSGDGLAVEVAYVGARPVEPVVETGGTTTQLFLPAGVHVMAFFPGTVSQTVRISGLAASDAVCIDRVSVGRYWPSEGASG